MIEILALGELVEGKLSPISSELISAAKSLEGTVGLVLLGKDLDPIKAEAASLGADKVYLVNHPLLGTSTIDTHVEAFEQVCRQLSPRVILIGKTHVGQDLAPRVAFRLGVGLAQDCTTIRSDPATGRVVAQRPVYGGVALATVTFPKRDPQMITIRSKVYEQSPNRVHPLEVIRLNIKLDASMIRVRQTGTFRTDGEQVRLEDAAIVVAGGRGLGGPAPFEDLKRLASALGAAVGASRAATDAGWVDHSLQVGLTGKTIAPNLYITWGISGASQHMAGCSGAKCIVAVNKDPDANIFKEASFGIIGNWDEVLPSFAETVNKLVK